MTCNAKYAASVIRAQLPFPKDEIDAVLDQLGPIGESQNGIALFDFFAVRDELERRHGIEAASIQADGDGDEEVECVMTYFDADGVEITASAKVPKMYLPGGEVRFYE